MVKHYKEEYSLHEREVAPDRINDKKIIKLYGSRFDEINRISVRNECSGLLAHRGIFIEVAALLRSELPFNADRLSMKLDNAISHMREITKS